MQRADKRRVLAITIVVGVLALAVGFALTRRADKAESWKPAAEGFLAVATPCCSEASLWEELDTVTADRQSARPATAAEAADWLNEWPYHTRDESDMPDAEELQLAARNSEVRCVGEPSGPEIQPDGDDTETLNAIHFRRECTFAKWKAWSAEAANAVLNERHTVWVDQEGFFHGRVDYWQ